MRIATRTGMAGMAACCLWCGVARTGVGAELTNASASTAPAADKREKAMKIVEHKSGQWSPGLTDSEKETLFAIVEDTLQWCVNGGKGRFAFDRYAITEKLRVKTATFVTLKQRGNLRGCIGSLAPVQPLYESVHANAVHAALEDYRAGATVDLEHDGADRDRTVGVPTLVLWGGARTAQSADMLSVWKARCERVEGRAIPGCGHFIPEELPRELVGELRAFLSRVEARGG